ncbi:MAG: type II toxin-antitoxin system prevent-host-death family antitoxin [Rhodospirillaceae bacterium]|nr:MAG: type II toxin-antitoxin system prevent-host-death family antitoxin [Rhodospirillaceae bacterium]
MDDVINMHDAKTHFSKLVDQVAATGRPVLIGKRGQALVQLSPLPQERTSPRPLGLFRAAIKLD